METGKKSILLACTAIVVSAVGVSAIVLGLRIKPQTVTKDYIESKDFQVSFAERVKRLAGWDLRFGAVHADQSLNFTMDDVVLETPSKAAGHAVFCRVPHITGQLSRGMKFADIKTLTLQQPTCEATLDADYRLDVGQVDPSLQFGDLTLLFGVDFKDVAVQGLELTVKQSNGADKAPQDVLRVANIDGTVQATLSFATARLQIALNAGAGGVKVAAKPGDGRTMRLTVNGKTNFTYERGDVAHLDTDLSVVDQDVVPSLDLGDKPLNLTAKMTAANADALDIASVTVAFGSMLSAQGEGRVESDASRPAMHLRRLTGSTQSGLHRLLGLSNLPGSIAEFAGATVDLEVLRAAAFQATLRGSLPTLTVRPDGREAISVKDASMAFEASTKDPASPIRFSGKTSVGEVSNPLNRVQVSGATQTLAGTLDPRGVIEIERYELKMPGDATAAELAGRVDVMTDPATVTLHGEVRQRLNVFEFGDTDVDGDATATVKVATVDGNYQVTGLVGLNIRKMTQDNITVEGLRGSLPIHFEIGQGFSNDLVSNASPDRLLDEYFQGVNSLEARLEAAADSILVKPDDSKTEVRVKGVNVTVDYRLLPNHGATELFGTVSGDSIAGARFDGTKADDLGYRVGGDFRYHGVGGAVTFRAKAESRHGGLEPLAMDGRVTASGHALNVSYDATGPVLQWVAEATGLAFAGDPSSAGIHGSLAFQDLLNDMDYSNWELLPFNYPYEGRVVGSGSFATARIGFREMEGVRVIEMPSVRGTYSHVGTVFHQLVTAGLTSDQAHVRLDSDGDYSLQHLDGQITGELDMPFPSTRTSFDFVASAHVAAPHRGQGGTLAFNGNGVLEAGHALRINSLKGSLDDRATLDLSGSVGNLHPVQQVDLQGVLTADFARLGDLVPRGASVARRKVEMPLNFRSVDASHLKLTGSVEPLDLDETPTKNRPVGGPARPFSLEWKVAGDNQVQRIDETTAH